ncbi:Heme A synthase [Polaribacter huanghezhanensis]|uniref:COX15/CtaA family protein n=1 Tax=Polaribacter huanghezhanensis TaxID=1354726 RepID=UPI002647CB86|nr:COX15/CtaA family protein [Polaribacter huanghezhanensis]WKD86733.1 Heme A synthase [Polaribacter huanghezhanensis]
MKAKKTKYLTTWLYSGLVLIAFMVIIGGITRLTQSGLSIVEWKPIHGVIPPLNDAEWQEEFAKYQQFPEYQKINKGMELSEFKMIFFWEYLHRLLGRLIGLVFIFPFVFFWMKKWFNQKQKKQLLLLLFLGGFQGFLGWFMVKSGLIDRPHVSHFRLAIHLLTAFGLMCYIYWLIMSFNAVPKKENTKIHKLSKWFIVVLITQIIYGAFVAGLKAGYFLDTNDTIIKQIAGYNFRNTNDFSLLYNALDIQAFHRIFAWVVFIVALIIYKKSRNTNLKGTSTLLLGLVLVQISLGIATLLLRVHLHTAVTHQLVAILVLLTGVRLFYLSGKLKA